MKISLRYITGFVFITRILKKKLEKVIACDYVNTPGIDKLCSVRYSGLL